MKNWFIRLFGGAAAEQPAPAPPRPSAPVPVTAPMPAHTDSDTAFLRWLAGPAPQEAPARADALILDELARLAATPDSGASLVPRVPAVIPQLLRSLRDDSVTGADLARQIGQDVVLVAEVIREANSPYYRPARPVKTVEGAVMLLGQNGMRMLLARVAFRPIISQQGGHFARLLAPQVWRHSEHCALAASLLAPRQGANPFEAYLAGLMHNVGLMVALRLIDQTHAVQQLPQSDAFCTALSAQARALSANIAAIWDFPATVSAAIRAAGHPGTDTLARTLAASDRLAKLRVLADAGVLDIEAVRASLGEIERACFDKLHHEED